MGVAGGLVVLQSQFECRWQPVFINVEITIIFKTFSRYNANLYTTTLV